MTELTQDEKLVILIEECSEVIQAATKCLRFGYTRFQPQYGYNHLVLASELGDLLGMVDALCFDKEQQKILNERQESKLSRATLIKEKLACG